MIIVKTPMRVPLCGGGSDLPEYYSKHGGEWVSAAVDKFVYVAVKGRFEKAIRAAYSKVEEVRNVSDLQHGIIREALGLFGVNDHIEVSSLADLPSGTGMGSSGAFTVGLVNALSVYTRRPVDNLAEAAYEVEREMLGRCVGKQDQYAAYLGDVRYYSCDREGRVTWGRVKVPELDKRLCLFYTGIRRDAAPVLKRVSDDEAYISKVVKIGRRQFDALESQDYNVYGTLLNEHWAAKRVATGKNKSIDALYHYGLTHGAVGGKLLGAGAGGFFMFYVPEERRDKLVVDMVRSGFPHIPFRFHPEGSRVMEV